MLDEAEWALVGPLLTLAVERIKAKRQAHGVGLAEARLDVGTEALTLYKRLTGMVETNVDALWHHRLSLFGPPCAACGRPLRTPRARHCAECGVAVEPPAGTRL